MRHYLGRALSCLLLTILLAPLGGCQDPPVGSEQTARLALETARRTSALTYAESAVRAAEFVQQAGLREAARQKGRPAPLRDYVVASRLLTEAAILANRASQHARDLTRALERLANADIAALETELSAHRRSLDNSLTLYQAERAYSKGAMALQTARHMFTKGEFAAARQEVASGRIALRQVARQLADRDLQEVPYLAMWRRWVDETVAQSRATGGSAIVVDKAGHRTHVLRAGRIVQTYRCDLGYNSARQKMYAGDGATPEGKYRVTNVLGRSHYYKALRLNYPNPEDVRRHAEARRQKRVRGSVGGLIEIHGHGGRNEDWTMGCVAITDRDMDDLLRRVGVGTPVTIVRRVENWP